MALTKKQKKYIIKNRKKQSLEELSLNLDLEKNQIKKFLDSQKETKSPWYFYLILILIPVLFFILLEIFLRLFGYGYNNDQWVSATKGKLLLNPDIARRYFYTTKNLPISIQDVFDEVKKDNAFRVFVLGGSSAAGYPYMPLGSFSRYLQQRLELVYPKSTIEVVNLSMTAVNSYTIRDIFPGVLEQKPDLIIFYAGHNEYYGALGIGSMESLGSSRTIVNSILFLSRFKTVELLRDVIRGVLKLFSDGDKKTESGTLMSRIAKDQYIPLNSDTYYAGIEQFEGNMSDILQMAKDQNIPVILGTLTCNLKDQKPFVSGKDEKLPAADEVFLNAHNELLKGNTAAADSLFRIAKDLDELRFRAPAKINETIEKLGKVFNCYVVDIDSAFNSVSPQGIVGNNLMTDHLHPTLRGYQLMGRVFYDAMEKEKWLPNSASRQIPENVQDSLTVVHFKFSELDSVIADYKIKILKNDWPFISKKEKKPFSILIRPENFIDSTAFETLPDKISWEAAHRKVATWYLQRKNYDGFIQQMDILISQFPVILEYYNGTAEELIKAQRYKQAYNYLVKRYRLKPDAYSTKWLGIIDLSEEKSDSAVRYLSESLTYNSRDDQVLYNLSGAYVGKKDYQKALETIRKCLKINPDFPQAKQLEMQLVSAIDKK